MAMDVKTGFTCIGKPAKGLFKSFLSIPSCGSKWDRDTIDGKCPICRGNLIPTFIVERHHNARKVGGPK